jgi:hypothetical protein
MLVAVIFAVQNVLIRQPNTTLNRLQVQRIFRDLRRTDFELATFREAGDASR